MKNITVNIQSLANKIIESDNENYSLAQKIMIATYLLELSGQECNGRKELVKFLWTHEKLRNKHGLKPVKVDRFQRIRRTLPQFITVKKTYTTSTSHVNLIAIKREFPAEYRAALNAAYVKVNKARYDSACRRPVVAKVTKKAVSKKTEPLTTADPVNTGISQPEPQKCEPKKAASNKSGLSISESPVMARVKALGSKTKKAAVTGSLELKINKHLSKSEYLSLKKQPQIKKAISPERKQALVDCTALNEEVLESYHAYVQLGWNWPFKQYQNEQGAVVTGGIENFKYTPQYLAAMSSERKDSLHDNTAKPREVLESYVIHTEMGYSWNYQQYCKATGVLLWDKIPAYRNIEKQREDKHTAEAKRLKCQPIAPIAIEDDLVSVLNTATH
ncbi:hypothetical protein [Photobacterium angustum]|uniref:hypothetical protein n=1 Tax=Photobacterium angustum TaxID=661 RepID=UPI0005E0B381|nr:hypothetical protein [Photobacterium angustum]KJG00107.1 hypothetical protein UB35_19855 [Photobacterium angustum]PSV61666.1 hypothetical protein CTM95_20405 [Photobacterium angustum]